MSDACVERIVPARCAYADAMADQSDSTANDVATHVAHTLKEAFAAVASAPLPPDERARWQQRLLAITNMTKHDVARAHDQLRRFQREWNALGVGKEIANDETDR